MLRFRMKVLGLGGCFALAAIWACSSSPSGSGFSDGDGGSSSSSGGSSGGSSGSGSGGSGGGSGSGSGGNIGSSSGSSGGDDSGLLGDVQTVVTNTIYAVTDDSLYSMDPQTQAVTLLGKMSGVSDASYEDSAITDIAVDAAGDVYVNTETVVYKANLPASNGVVSLTKVAGIQNVRIYALAFTPKDALGAGTGEVLIGGDGSGELWSIDITSGGNGATKDLGNFGQDPDDSTGTKFMALSGDLVFYMSGTTPTGLATIRSCAPPPAKYPTDSPTCTSTDDVLSGVNMTALAAAYGPGGVPAKGTAGSLNGGMYGGSATTKGPGTGHGKIYGLGAWDGNVFGFSSTESASDAGPAEPAQLLTIATPSGASSVGAGSFSFTNGWSGAAVTTTVTVTVTAPPPPPPVK